MTPLLEAAQQALEALEYIHTETTAEEDKLIHAAITALRAALDQPEQEPVAMPVEALANALVMSRIVHPDAVDDSLGYDDGATMDRIQGLYRRIKGSLYTHPPRREWRSLSDDEIDGLTWHPDRVMLNTHLEFARAVEAALKERNA